MRAVRYKGRVSEAGMVSTEVLMSSSVWRKETDCWSDLKVRPSGSLVSAEEPQLMR